MRVWCDDTTCRFNNCGISCTKESVDLEREQLGGKAPVVVSIYRMKKPMISTGSYIVRIV